MREINKISEALFQKIRDRFEDVTLGDEQAKATQDPEKAQIFNFDYTADGKNHGNITISLIDAESLKIYFSKNISENLSDEEKKDWYSFLKEMREFAKRNLLRFEPRDITRGTLKHRDLESMTKTDVAFDTDDIALAEGKMYGSSKSSYQDKGSTKIIVRHTDRVNTEQRGARSRKIGSVFIENFEGERFKLPHNNLKYARAMARHVNEGGTLGDEFGTYLTGLAEDMKKLRPFKNKMVRRTFEDAETQAMVESTFEYYRDIRKTLESAAGKRGYKRCLEAFAADENSNKILDEEDVDSLRERFVKREFDESLEDALPLVQKAYNMKKESKYSKQFESWVDTVSEGTWAMAETDEEIKALAELLSDELIVGIDAMNATGALGPYVGDDELFDELGEIADVDPDSDVSDHVLQWIGANQPDLYDALLQTIEHGETIDSDDGYDDIASAELDMEKNRSDAAYDFDGMDESVEQVDEIAPAVAAVAGGAARALGKAAATKVAGMAIDKVMGSDDEELDEGRKKTFIQVSMICQTDGKGYWSEKIADVKVDKVQFRLMDNDFGECRAYFNTSTWDTNKDGLIYTDKTWLKDFREQLGKITGFSRGALLRINYSEQGMQGDNYVSMDIGKSTVREVLANNLPYVNDEFEPGTFAEDVSEKTCPTCQGAGEWFDDADDSLKDCPDCQGAGSFVDEAGSIQRIDDETSDALNGIDSDEKMELNEDTWDLAHQIISDYGDPDMSAKEYFELLKASNIDPEIAQQVIDELGVMEDLSRLAGLK